MQSRWKRACHSAGAHWSLLPFLFCPVDLEARGYRPPAVIIDLTQLSNVGELNLNSLSPPVPTMKAVRHTSWVPFSVGLL